MTTFTSEDRENASKCNPHPDAPHGFMRNESHNAGRYVCECEFWNPEKCPWDEWKATKDIV